MGEGLEGSLRNNYYRLFYKATFSSIPRDNKQQVFYARSVGYIESWMFENLVIYFFLKKNSWMVRDDITISQCYYFSLISATRQNFTTLDDGPWTHRALSLITYSNSYVVTRFHWIPHDAKVYHRPRSEGDNALDSVRLSVRLFVCLCSHGWTVWPTTLIFGMGVDLDLG